MTFTQPAPELGNQYRNDRVLRSYLKRVLKPETLDAIEPGLDELGELTGGELYEMQLADRLNEPRLTHYDPWGTRIDHIELTPLWREAEKLAARFGVVGAAYEKQHGAQARIHQFALAYLFQPATDFYTCPLAMTDAAARALLASGNDALVQRAVPRLTSRDPEHAWTSGQWMTETIGGSDVGHTETVARQDKDGRWRLYGRKWFTSAATSRMALVLARPEGNEDGADGLALFYVEPYDRAARLKDIRLLRLKDKLGTCKVPTAELQLDGVAAEPVNGLRHGVRNIVPMLNVTRVWNAVGATATMRRGLALATDYAAKRKVFGKYLSEQPLHVDTLAGLWAEFEAAFQLSFFTVELLGRVEAGEADEHETYLLRLLTPIAKLTTCKQVVFVTSEVLEAFGGAGYIEDTGLPVLLRDAQVFPIWEGTTNVLALDTLRALQGGDGLEAYLALLQKLLSGVKSEHLQASRRCAEKAVNAVARWYEKTHAEGTEALQKGARRFAMTLGRTLALALLLRHAQWTEDKEDDKQAGDAAIRFAMQEVAPTSLSPFPKGFGMDAKTNFSGHG